MRFYDPKSVVLYLASAFCLANVFYFVAKGFTFQSASFGYVWSTFNYFVAAVFFLFMKAFWHLAGTHAELKSKKR